jgi:hypothetical protein
MVEHGQTATESALANTFSFHFEDWLRQLGDVRRDPSRLVLREQLGLNVRFAPIRECSLPLSSAVHFHNCWK